jgi:VWFA-related protein
MRRIYHPALLVSIYLLPALLAAQQPVFRANVPVVLIPVSVTDAKGHYIDGLQATDFTLLDNGAPREIQIDTSDTVSAPVAVVIAIQANERSAAALGKIRRTGSMIQPLLTGDRGHAAVISYGDEVRVLQDFTSDPQEIIDAFTAVKAAGAGKAILLDAISRAVSMLAARPHGERRVVLVIGESKDSGSEVKLADAVVDIQRSGLTLFHATFSAWVTPFTTKASELPRATGASGGILAALGELVRLGKVNAAEALAQESGGRVLSFATLKALEQLLTHIGEEVHSQYLISAPALKEPEGFHKVEVRVRERPTAVIRARPGYWVVP